MQERVRRLYRWDAVAESYMRLAVGLPADYSPAREDEDEHLQQSLAG
jgi:hypothetical protein